MMNWFKIAWLNVIRNSRRSIIAVFTVAIVACALLLAYGYINFTFWGLTRSIVQGGMGNMHIADNRLWEDFESEPLEFGLNNEDADDLVSTLMQNKQVRQAMKRLAFSGIVSNGEISTIFQGTGIESKKERRLHQGNITGSFISGRALNQTNINPYQVVLAKGLAHKLTVEIGDSVTMLSNTVEGGINAIDVMVVGIYDTGIPMLNKIELKIPLFSAQELLLTKKISRVVVQLKDIEATDIALADIKKIASDKGVRTWYELAPYFQAVENIYYSIFTVMGSIILIVALLSVSNVMNTSVNERISEVGTLRAFGIAKKYLRLDFMFEGLIIGFIGSIIGVFLGLIITIVINQSNYIMPPPPGRTESYPLLFLPTTEAALIIILASCLLGIIASYLPINKALKKKIVEQLDYD